MEAPYVDRESKKEEVTMSSEQQERQAMQYVERSSLLTVRTLLKLLEWSARQALAQDSAYKIGVQNWKNSFKALTSLKR